MIYWDFIGILLNFYCAFITSISIFYLWKYKKNFLFIKKIMDSLVEELYAIEGSVANNGKEVKKNRIKEFLKTSDKNSKKIFGKTLTDKDIDGLSDADLEKYYGICENHLARQMSDCLGKTIVGFYADIVGNKILKLKDTGDLKNDLEKDPFTNAALRKFTCNLYFSFGAYLAPVTIGAITLKHYLKTENKEINFDSEKNSDLEKDG